MKSGIKTLAIWLIIIIISVALLSGLLNNSDRKMNYSELIQAINQGQISEIEISSDKETLYVTEKSGDVTNRVKEVTIPSLDTFMEEISENIASRTNCCYTRRRVCICSNFKCVFAICNFDHFLGFLVVADES